MLKLKCLDKADDWNLPGCEMREYIARRLLLMIVTLFLVSIIVFLMIRLVPGDIVESMIAEIEERHAYLYEIVANREVLERAFGVDVPIHVQYGRWIGVLPSPDWFTGEPRYNGILQGSLGLSLRSSVPVTTLILSRIAVTAELGLMAIVISLITALPIGIYSAIRQDTVGDYATRILAIIFISVPSFWVAMLILLYPAIWWGWSPEIKIIFFREDPLGNLWQFFIPAFMLGMAKAGGLMRITRSMMLEVLRQDYIRTAYSKGLKERVVVIRHALKNGLIPVVTIVGAGLPMLVGGSVIMEQIFALPGMGRLLIEALQRRDYTIVSGISLVIATAIVLANLVVDISYAYLDPRVRYG